MSQSQIDLHIYILGSYRSIDESKRDLNRLLRLEEHLQGLGYDAFLAVHKDRLGTIDLKKISPREKTQQLVRFADLNLFVFTKSGVRNGLVAELTETQASQPDLTDKHMVLIERGLTLSSIIDESKGGILSIGPIRQIHFDSDEKLLEVAEQVAFNYAAAKRANLRP